MRIILEFSLDKKGLGRQAVLMNTSPQNIASKKIEQPHGFRNIIINVLIPVLILNKLSSKLGPGPALALALAFPFSAGAYELIKQKKVNYFSLLGLINVSLTGTIVLLKLDGFWFAIKDAVFPSLIGCFVIASSFTQNPFIKTMLLNPQMMNIELIHNKLEELGKWADFEVLLKKATQMLGATFFVSAVINFFLALRIFTPLDQGLDEIARQEALNQQIAQMTGYAFGVILVPSIIMMIGILLFLMKGITMATGLKQEEILKN